MSTIGTNMHVRGDNFDEKSFHEDYYNTKYHGNNERNGLCENDIKELEEYRTKFLTNLPNGCKHIGNGVIECSL